MRLADPERAVRDFGRRVGEERVRAGWTQAELAEVLGVSTRYVQHVEGGKQNLTIMSAVQMANALRVPLVALFAEPTTAKPARGRPRRPSATET